MALLVLDRVWKRFPRGNRGVRERVALREVSLDVEPGELVAVWGRRRSGRTTLLRVGAGVEPPSEGAVRFDGVDLSRRSQLGAHRGIGYCTTHFPPLIGGNVLEQVAAPLLGADRGAPRAQARALEALRQVGVADCAELDTATLDHGEAIRVALARALVTAPRVLLVDEPVSGLSTWSERDTTLALLRATAHDHGTAVLMTVDEAAALSGADRALSIDAGEVRGETRADVTNVVSISRSRLTVRGA